MSKHPDRPAGQGFHGLPHAGRLQPMVDSIVDQIRELAKPTARWVSVAERKPGAYVDVVIRLEDASQRVGRVNQNGDWQLASYQHCKHQYLCNPVAWLEVGPAVEPPLPVAAPAPAVPSGWRLEDIGPQIHIYAPDGKWAAVRPDADSPARTHIYQFMRAMLTAAPAPKAHDLSHAEQFKCEFAKNVRHYLEFTGYFDKEAFSFFRERVMWYGGDFIDDDATVAISAKDLAVFVKAHGGSLL